MQSLGGENSNQEFYYSTNTRDREEMAFWIRERHRVIHLLLLAIFRTGDLIRMYSVYSKASLDHQHDASTEQIRLLTRLSAKSVHSGP